jgi:hypothetical protein
MVLLFFKSYKQSDKKRGSGCEPNLLDKLVSNFKASIVKGSPALDV